MRMAVAAMSPSAVLIRAARQMSLAKMAKLTSMLKTKMFSCIQILKREISRSVNLGKASNSVAVIAEMQNCSLALRPMSMASTTDYSPFK